jgi:hypothetical protein
MRDLRRSIPNLTKRVSRRMVFYPAIRCFIFFVRLRDDSFQRNPKPTTNKHEDDEITRMASANSQRLYTKSPGVSEPGAVLPATEATIGGDAEQTSNNCSIRKLNFWPVATARGSDTSTPTRLFTFFAKPFSTQSYPGTQSTYRDWQIRSIPESFS